MIRSTANPKVKYVRRLQTERRFRHREHAFVMEGSRWLAELLQLDYPPQLVLYTEKWAQESVQAELLSQLKSPALMVAEDIMQLMSDVETPPGVLAVVTQRPLPLPTSPTFLLILDGVANPGNMGTILRTAAAAGVEGVLLAPGCVDVYNPKAVRGGMGAQLRLPMRHTNWVDIAEQTASLHKWVATVAGDTIYTNVPWQKPSALIIGGEARGASKESLVLANGRLTIPMQADTESLNAAIAAGIILFEAVRQRS